MAGSFIPNVRALDGMPRGKSRRLSVFEDNRIVKVNEKKRTFSLDGAENVEKRPNFIIGLTARVRKPILINDVIGELGPIYPSLTPDFYYAEETYNFLKKREALFIVNINNLIGDDIKLEKVRAALVDWLIVVVHHFKMSQETLYHTISLIDRTLEIRYLKKEEIYLLGISSLLIASKLEEYCPADIDEMIKSTKGEYTRNQVLQMEKTLLKLHSFNVYGTEPVTLINRCIFAMNRQNDENFKEMVFFLFDSFLFSKYYSGVLSSKVSAAAVYGADLLCHSHGEFSHEHFLGFKEEDIQQITHFMIKTVLWQNTEKRASTFIGLRRKYSSRSRHRNILGSSKLNTINLNRVLYMLTLRIKESK